MTIWSSCMNNEHSSNYDEDFMGEHFEALGDVWHAIFREDSEIASHLNEIIAEFFMMAIFCFFLSSQYRKQEF